MRRALAPLVLCLALAPSAWLAWRARDVPHLGYFHDDSLYLVCAKSLAGGAGYRIESLPGAPYQAKYPPLYPMLLAAVWRLFPKFPANLPYAVLLSWLTLVACVLTARVTLRQLGVGAPLGWILSAALALNPYLALCGMSLLSELPFTCLVIAALGLIACASRASAVGCRLALAAGALASAAFLTRSAGVVLIAAGSSALLIAKLRRRAGAFVAAALPGLVGWTLWAHSHQLARGDVVSLYYTDYLGFYARSLSVTDLAIMLWNNLDSLLSALGGMVVFGLDDSLASKSLARVLALAAIAGTIRLWERPSARVYVLFACGYLLTLVAWNYTPDQRFLVPVFPVLLAGFAAEVARFMRALRRDLYTPVRSRRVVAGAIAAAIVGLALLAVWSASLGLFRVLPRFIEGQREKLAAQRAVYVWIASNTPPHSLWLAYQDALLYLYTGRSGVRLVIPPALVYRGDTAALARLYVGAAGFARQQRLSHALLAPGDLSAELPANEQRNAVHALRANPRFKRLFEIGGVSANRID